MANLGYVGLGAMGSRVVKRLLDADHTVTGYNRTKMYRFQRFPFPTNFSLPPEQWDSPRKTLPLYMRYWLRWLA